MKKIILPFIISFIILIAPSISYADIATKAKVNATAVRIREIMSTDSNIVTNIYQEDEVEVLEEDGEWYKVQYGDKVGYAKAEFFTITQQGDLVDNPSSSENSSNETEAQNNVTEESVVNNTENEIIEEQNVVENQEVTETTTQELNIGDSITLSNILKVRVIPSLSSTTKTEISQGTNIIIETKLGKWYKITGENLSGWVLEQKLNDAIKIAEQQPEVPQQPVQPEPEVTKPENTTTPETTQVNTAKTTNKTAIVIVETARIRSSASKDGEIIDVLDEDDIVTILGEEGEFYKISSEKIGTGYISKSLVKEKDVTSRSSIEERENTVSMEQNDAVNQALSQGTSSSITGNDVIEFAKQFLGYPYVLGCSTPENGFDCSGFTRYVFAHFGYTLGQVAANQTSLGEVVNRESLQTGDLILFYNDGKTKIGHCGIYIGGGDFIHSANPERGVVIDNLNTNSYYAQRFFTARRIVF